MVIIYISANGVLIMYDEVLSLESAQHIFKLQYDEHVENPRSGEYGDNISHFVIPSHKYSTGECQDKVNDVLRKVAKALGFAVYGRTNRELIEAFLESKNKQIGRYIEIQPLYVYDHSGVTYSTSPFHCRWDSGQVGWVFTTRYDYENFGLKEKFNPESAREKIEQEVEHWDNYAQGNTYCFTVEDHEGETLESVGGFIGDYREVTKMIIDEYLLDYPDIVALKDNI